MKTKQLVSAMAAAAALLSIGPAYAGPKDVEPAEVQADAPAPQVAANPNWVQSQVGAMIRAYAYRQPAWNSGATAAAPAAATPSLDQATLRQLIARGATIEIPICPTYIQGAGRANQTSSSVNSTSMCMVQGLSLGGGMRGR